MSGTETSIADLFTSFAALRPRDEQTERVIARLLHFADPVPAQARLSGAWHGAQPKGGTGPTAPLKRPRLAEQEATTVRSGSPTTPGQLTQVKVTGVQTGPMKIPDWIEVAEPMAASAGSVTLEPDSLFEPNQTRNVLAAGVATRVFEGPIHIERVIQMVVSLRPLAQVPRHPIGTLRRGAQVLVDFGPAMVPYAADRDQLVAALGKVVGRSRLDVLGFRGTPLRELDRDGEVVPWRMPPRGTPVVLISDLGIGGSAAQGMTASRQDWLQVARSARAAGCPIVAFVPFGAQRWDRGLAKAIVMIHWDRSTTAADIRLAIGRGHVMP